MNYTDYIKFHSEIEQNILDLAKERHELYKNYKANKERIIEINTITTKYYSTINYNYYTIENLKTEIGEKYKTKNNLDVITRITNSAIKNYKTKNYTITNCCLCIQYMSGMLSQYKFIKIMKRSFLSHGAATESLNKLILFANTL